MGGWGGRERRFRFSQFVASERRPTVARQRSLSLRHFVLRSPLQALSPAPTRFPAFLPSPPSPSLLLSLSLSRRDSHSRRIPSLACLSNRFFARRVFLQEEQKRIRRRFKLLTARSRRSSSDLSPRIRLLSPPPKTSPKTAPSVVHRSAGRGARPASGGRPSVSFFSFPGRTREKERRKEISRAARLKRKRRWESTTRLSFEFPKTPSQNPLSSPLRSRSQSETVEQTAFYLPVERRECDRRSGAAFEARASLAVPPAKKREPLACSLARLLPFSPRSLTQNQKKPLIPLFPFSFSFLFQNRTSSSSPAAVSE